MIVVISVPPHSLSASTTTSRPWCSSMNDDPDYVIYQRLIDGV
ncbi:hypothetical protein ABLN97_07485 [Mycobacterium tuberculosis]